MVLGRKTNIIVQATAAERHELESWQRSTTINAGLHRRSRIIRRLADGVPVSETARLMGVKHRNVYTWADRFSEASFPGLEDKPGRGRNSKSAMAAAGVQFELPPPALETPQPSWQAGWMEAPVFDVLAVGAR